MIKIWVDDIRVAPEGWTWVKTNDECLRLIFENKTAEEMLVSLDHDSGCEDEKDYIEILSMLDFYARGEGMNFAHIRFHFHTDNIVGRQNMRTIVQRNGWREAYSIR